VAQKFLPDDPIRADRDNGNIPTPRPQAISDYYDFIQNSFGHPGDRRPRTAMNINTLGEVPDSSWFTNRHGRRRMSIEELARGPDRSAGPAEGNWTIREGKNEGVTPGFRFARDARGDLYALKFDPRGNLEMATSADVIGTKFFYAFGYNVPENYIVYFRPEQLELAEGAVITDTLGRKRKMDRHDILEVLSKVARLPDGRYRAVASRILDGEALKEFRYYGTRPDDPNDIFPHEHRRELRGLRVFSSWLNHDDSRAINTLNMLVKEDGRQFIRHHLIDFGSILGSGSVSEQKPRAGNEYLWEPGIAFTRMLTFGFWDRDWIAIHYPVYPSIGKFEAERFRPETWKPEYPNPAFLNCLPEDGYWAAKIIMSFTDDEIRALMRTGQISDRLAEDYVVQCLIQRRDKIGRYWLSRVNSVDNFRIDDAGQLHFEDLVVRYGFAKAPGYVVSWYRYDNQNDRKVLLDRPREYEGSPIPILNEARTGPGGAYYSVRIQRRIEESGKIPKAVHLYFRRAGGRLELVGIEREE
jgi:hypothetical protein